MKNSWRRDETRAKDERLRAKDNLIAAYQAAEYVTFLAERAACCGLLRGYEDVHDMMGIPCMMVICIRVRCVARCDAYDPRHVQT
jgi:hypothetical protein